MTNVYAFTGIAGTGVRKAITRLAEKIKDARGADVAILSIDEKVWQLFTDVARKDSNLRAELELEAHEVAIDARPDWWRFLMLTKGRVRGYWRKAGEAIAKEIQASACDYIFLTFHANYQSDYYRWRFSPVDPVILHSIDMKAFFTLIDDVYYVHQVRIEDVNAEKSLSRIEDDPWMRSAELIRWTVDSLTDLIHWRQEEISTTEVLAAACEVPSQVLSVRHPMPTVLRLIDDPEKSYYFSHPITSVRKDPNFRSTSDFQEIHEFSGQLRGRVTIIEPTTIDEYRIRYKDENEHRRFFPELTPRWPFLAEEADLMGEPVNIETFREREPLCCAANIRDLEIEEEYDRLMQGEAAPDHQNNTSATVMRLAGAINEDITWRDHTLVDQTRRLIVFRPTPHGKPSGGVKRELFYYRKLAPGGTDIPRSFIYQPNEDSEALAATTTKKIIGLWRASPEIKPFIVPSLQDEERELEARLIEILIAQGDIDEAAQSFAAALESRIHPAVNAPAPMSLGRRGAVLARRREIFSEAKRIAANEMIERRYFDLLILNPFFQLVLTRTKYELIEQLGKESGPKPSEQR